MPTYPQIATLILSAILFSIGAVMSLTRIWHDWRGKRLAAKVCVYVGLVIALLVLAWHSNTRGDWVPLGDNFDTLIWLGLLLAAFVLYIQRRRPVGGLDWFLFPVVSLLLLAAAVFGRAKHQQYMETTWSYLHVVMLFGCAIPFFVAGAAVVMYLISNHRLRSKSLSPGPNLGSLERLEHMTLTSVTVGFAMLTIGALMSAPKMAHGHEGGGGGGKPLLAKIALSVAAWVVYAIVLHSPINPRFKGRKVAILSIVGFVLIIGAIVAAQFMKQQAAGGTH